MKIQIPRYITLSRFLFVLAFFYLEVISLRIINIPNLYVLLLLGGLVATFFETQSNFKRAFHSSTILSFILFIVICAVGVYLVAVNKSVGMQAITRLFEYLLLGLMIYTFSAKDGNLLFVAKVMFSLGVVVCLLMVFSPETFSEGVMRTVYLSYSSDVNPHVTAIIEVLGLWAILYLFSYKDKIYLRDVIFSLLSIAFFMYAIILTNSRKGFIAALIVLIISLPNYWKLIKEIMGTKQRISIGFCVIIIIGLAGLWVLRTGVLTQNNFWDRIATLSDNSNAGRISYVIEGFKVFLKHPLIGVGLNNFRYYSYAGTYSHCTYAELPACSGILGTIPFAIMYIKTIINILNSKKSYASDLCRKRLMIAMILVLLFISFTQISFYIRELMIMIFIMGAYGEYEIRQDKT
jgi:hypothetical protein